MSDVGGRPQLIQPCDQGVDQLRASCCSVLFRQRADDRRGDSSNVTRQAIRSLSVPQHRSFRPTALVEPLQPSRQLVRHQFAIDTRLELVRRHRGNTGRRVLAQRRAEAQRRSGRASPPRTARSTRPRLRGINREAHRHPARGRRRGVARRLAPTCRSGRAVSCVSASFGADVRYSAEPPATSLSTHDRASGRKHRSG